MHQNKNSQTLEVYEKHFSDYASQVEVEKRDFGWLFDGLKNVATTASIFEIGSGMGIEADDIESRGYKVQRSDAASSFRAHMSSNGKKSISFNVLGDEFAKSYDVIIANGVFLHFDREDFRKILKKIHEALTDDGVLLFSVQNGDGEEWKSNKGAPRFFCYWRQEQLMNELENTGYLVRSICAFGNNKWLGVVAKKLKYEHQEPTRNAQ